MTETYVSSPSPSHVGDWEGEGGRGRGIRVSGTVCARAGAGRWAVGATDPARGPKNDHFGAVTAPARRAPRRSVVREVVDALVIFYCLFLLDVLTDLWADLIPLEYFEVICFRWRR